MSNLSTLMEDYATVTLKCEGLEVEIDNLRETLIGLARTQEQHRQQILHTTRQQLC